MRALHAALRRDLSRLRDPAAQNNRVVPSATPGFGIVRATRQYPLEGVKKDEIDTALGYFENNAPRMRYHWFRQCGLFVGSGVVEASCKSLTGQRLKQSGMHWTVPGADAIIALRCQEASSTWETICNPPHTQTRTA